MQRLSKIDEAGVWDLSGDCGDPIDPRVVAELRKIETEEGDNFLNEVIALFLADLDEQLVSIVKAVRSGNLQLAGIAAHSIGGSARNYGAHGLSTICACLEKAAVGESFDLETLLQLLEVEAGRVRLALSAERRVSAVKRS